MVLHHLGVLLLCLASASSLPLASATSSQTTVKTTATKSAKLGGRLGRKSAADAQRFLAAATKQSVATPVSGEKEPKAPAHCRDTKAGCTHAAKVKARAKKAAKLPAAEQAEVKQSTNASAVHRLLKGGQWAEAAACWRTDWATVCPQQAQLPAMPPTSCPRHRPNTSCMPSL